MVWKNKAVKVDLILADINDILEWYRCSHHFERCERNIKGCHMTRDKMLEIAKQLNQLQVKPAKR